MSPLKPKLGIPLAFFPKELEEATSRQEIANTSHVNPRVFQGNLTFFYRIIADICRSFARNIQGAWTMQFTEETMRVHWLKSD